MVKHSKWFGFRLCITINGRANNSSNTKCVSIENHAYKTMYNNPKLDNNANYRGYGSQ